MVRGIISWREYMAWDPFHDTVDWNKITPRTDQWDDGRWADHFKFFGYNMAVTPTCLPPSSVHLTDDIVGQINRLAEDGAIDKKTIAQRWPADFDEAGNLSNCRRPLGKPYALGGKIAAVSLWRKEVPLCGGTWRPPNSNESDEFWLEMGGSSAMVASAHPFPTATPDEVTAQGAKWPPLSEDELARNFPGGEIFPGEGDPKGISVCWRRKEGSDFDSDGPLPSYLCPPPVGSGLKLSGSSDIPSEVKSFFDRAGSEAYTQRFPNVVYILRGLEYGELVEIVEQRERLLSSTEHQSRIRRPVPRAIFDAISALHGLVSTEYEKEISKEEHIKMYSALMAQNDSKDDQLAKVVAVASKCSALSSKTGLDYMDVVTRLFREMESASTRKVSLKTFHEQHKYVLDRTGFARDRFNNLTEAVRTALNKAVDFSTSAYSLSRTLDRAERDGEDDARFLNVPIYFGTTRGFFRHQNLPPPNVPAFMVGTDQYVYSTQSHQLPASEGTDDNPVSRRRNPKNPNSISRFEDNHTCFSSDGEESVDFKNGGREQGDAQGERSKGESNSGRAKKRGRSAEGNGQGPRKR